MLASHEKTNNTKVLASNPSTSQNVHTDTPTMSILQRLRLESLKSFLLYRALPALDNERQSQNELREPHKRRKRKIVKI